MLKKPKIKSCYHAEFLDRESVLLLSEKNDALLSGGLYNRVLAAIPPGGTGVEELIETLDGKISAPEVIYALNTLNKEGYLTEATPGVPDELCAYYNSMDIDVSQLLTALEENPVSIKTAGTPPPLEPFFQALKKGGVKTIGDGGLTVFVTDDYERKELESFNREALASGRSWLLFKPGGIEPWLGPLFVPGQTGCWACLKQRLNLNRRLNAMYKARNQTGEPPPLPQSFSPLSLAAAVNLAALEIVKHLYHGNNQRLLGHLLTLDTSGFKIEAHPLVKRPQCEVCGDKISRDAEPQPVTLSRKTFFSLLTEGGYREVSPEETVETYGHHVSHLTGVVQTLKPYDIEKGSPVRTYYSGHNIALRSQSLSWLNHHMRSRNAGKGRTWPQAKAGALCESLERYSCTYQGDEPFIYSSLDQLGDRGIHPNVCMNYSEAQYGDRDRINSHCTRFHFMVPVPFEPAREMHWAPLYSLTEATFKYLPSCYCYTQYPAPDERNLFSYPDTNGNAAGNSLEEAILQGILELVERDAVSIWWHNRLRMPGVDLESFNRPYFNRMLEYYRSLGRSLYVLDLTTDLGIPAFVAVSHRPGQEKQDIIAAFGAHVDAGIGIERALSELNQFLWAVHVPGGDPSQRTFRTEDKHFIQWLDTATMENQPYMAPDTGQEVKRADRYPESCPPNIYDALTYCIQTVRGRGLEPLVLDMTRPDIGLPVVKVVVPGLRHFWKRLAPGRLYDVPVQMGWLEKPYKEEELNPLSLFI